MNGGRADWAVCGGGTGGHIFPALAVAKALQTLQPGVRVAYLGKNGGMEEGLAERWGFPFYGFELDGFTRSLAWRNVRSVCKAGRAFLRARACLRELAPKAVLGTGGYVCGPVLAAAMAQSVPTVIHESNRVPGLTNRLLAPWATRVAVSDAEAMAALPRQKTFRTGFPLRPDLNQISREEACRRLGLDPGRRILFVFPGSLAARRINQAVALMLPRFHQQMPGWQILWMTGPADLEMARHAQTLAQGPNVILPFVHEVPEAYAAADLVLARAGAGTLAELEATAKPALLVPYPYATADHQTRNAEHLKNAGAARVMLDRELGGERLPAVLAGMSRELESLAACARKVRETSPLHAAETIAGWMIEIGQRKNSGGLVHES